MMASQALAYGGDEDTKNKNGKNSSKSVSALDTLQVSGLFDRGNGITNTDDTLVFEDWENHSNGGVQSDDLGLVGSADSDSNKDGMSLSDCSLNQEVVVQNTNSQYERHFSIYPNPVMRILHINPEVTPILIRITDVQGREYYQNEYTTQVDIYDLPIGTYFIQLVYEDHKESRRFLKK